VICHKEKFLEVILFAIRNFFLSKVMLVYSDTTNHLLKKYLETFCSIMLKQVNKYLKDEYGALRLAGNKPVTLLPSDLVRQVS